MNRGEEPQGNVGEKQRQQQGQRTWGKTVPRVSRHSNEAATASAGWSRE